MVINSWLGQNELVRSERVGRQDMIGSKRVGRFIRGLHWKYSIEKELIENESSSKGVDHNDLIGKGSLLEVLALKVTL
jgi:hypothetical protein